MTDWRQLTRMSHRWLMAYYHWVHLLLQAIVGSEPRAYSQRRSEMNEEENWLHGKQIECPNCHQWLYRVDHSPFYDGYSRYCNRCPIHVEISYYDPVVRQVEQQVRQASEARQGEWFVTFVRALEERLKPCRFGQELPPRCASSLLHLSCPRDQRYYHYRRSLSWVDEL